MRGVDDVSFGEAITQLLKAGTPMIVVNTYEEERVEEVFAAVLESPDALTTPRKFLTWSCISGLSGVSAASSGSTKDVRTVLDRILVADSASVYLLKDMHQYFGAEGNRTDSHVVRALREIAARNRRTTVPITVVLVVPKVLIPWDLRKSVTIIDFPLPTAAELGALLDLISTANSNDENSAAHVRPGDRQALVSAAAGLTIAEAENAFAAALVSNGALTSDDVAQVLEHKKQRVRTDGVLDVITRKTHLDDVGGLENLKHWLSRRDGAWLPPAQDYAVPAPRGLLITGVPGCGKSMTAMAVASEWGLPLLRLDLGRVLSGIVGSSEHNMRSALSTAEAIAPCVLWIDEIDKGFSGVSNSLDSGVTRRIFGTFLTWMQERTEAVFVIATANAVDQLPAEFLRKGRFDEIFFVDLPTEAERLPIWRTHINKRLARGPKARGAFVVDGATLDDLVARSEGYSGAEIEQCVINGLYEAFAEKRPLELADLRDAIDQMVPLSVTQESSIATLREWADTRAVSATSRGAEGGSGGTVQRAPDYRTKPPRGGRVVDF